MKTKTKKPKLSEKDTLLLLSFMTDKPSDLVFWSFRYFLGRMSIATTCFANSLANAWPHLDERVQHLIKYELEREFALDDRARKDKAANPESTWNYLPLGHDCDREAWQKVRDAYTK